MDWKRRQDSITTSRGMGPVSHALPAPIVHTWCFQIQARIGMLSMLAASWSAGFAP